MIVAKEFSETEQLSTEISYQTVKYHTQNSIKKRRLTREITKTGTRGESDLVSKTNLYLDDLINHLDRL